MIYREWMWGFFFLLSAVFIISISLWSLFIYLEHSYILFFEFFEYILFIYSVIITLVAIGAMVRSFYYAKTDLTYEKTVRWYIKVIVIGTLFFKLYNIYLIIDILLRW